MAEIELFFLISSHVGYFLPWQPLYVCDLPVIGSSVPEAHALLFTHTHWRMDLFYMPFPFHRDKHAHSRDSLCAARLVNVLLKSHHITTCAAAIGCCLLPAANLIRTAHEICNLTSFFLWAISVRSSCPLSCCRLIVSAIRPRRVMMQLKRDMITNSKC